MAKTKEHIEGQTKESGTVMAAQLYAGVDMLGSVTSINGKNAEISELPHGLRCVSKKTGRVVVIPYSNVRGYELK